jgi:hypothetical protein
MVFVAGVLNAGGLRVAAYLGCAAACALAASGERAASRSGARVTPGFWWALAVLLLALGLARDLGLEGDLTQAGRHFARSEGLYPDRRPAQRLAIEVLVAAAAAIGAAGLVFRGARWRRYRLPFSVTVALCCYVLVRAVSLHDVDLLLYDTTIGGVTLGAAIELAVVALLAALAMKRCREAKLESRRAPARG